VKLQKKLKVAKVQKAAGGPHSLAPKPKPGSSSNKSKFHTFNMETYKLHGIFDVSAMIRAFGVIKNKSTLNVGYSLLN
jgi:hypothetical protein